MKKFEDVKIIQEEDTPMINKYGDFVYSKKHKLMLSLDKTNKKKKKIQISTTNPLEKVKQVEKIMYEGPLYTYNNFKTNDPDQWCKF